MSKPSFLSNLQWRFATKSFDRNKKLDTKTLDAILEAIRYTPTSLGLQTLHTYVISNQELKDKIKEQSYGQSQVSDASHVLVFCCRTDVLERVKQYAQYVRENKVVSIEKADAMERMMTNSVTAKTADEIVAWTSSQAYIALGFAMAACAELQVDSCPMEGFKPEAVNKLLDLPDHMKSVLLLPIGYRKEGPSREKVRFSSSDLFTHLD